MLFLRILTQFSVLSTPLEKRKFLTILPFSENNTNHLVAACFALSLFSISMADNAKPSKVSWADLLSDDSNSFRAPPPAPAPAAAASSLTTTAGPARKGATTRRKFRAMRSIPLNGEDSYRAPVEENSKNSLNAEIAGFGLWLPKGEVEVEDSNTQGGISNKRPISDLTPDTTISDPQRASKRARGQFPVDPVFGGEMTTRTSGKNSK
jgi:hypothetical protein